MDWALKMKNVWSGQGGRHKGIFVLTAFFFLKACFEIHSNANYAMQYRKQLETSLNNFSALSYSPYENAFKT